MDTPLDNRTRPPSGSPAMLDIYVARHSIYDARLQVIGYEVLFRGSHENRAVVSDGNQATSDLLLSAVVDIGLERLVGSKMAFVNMTREFLLGHNPLPLNNRQLVLEILEDIAIDQELIDGVSKLVSQGYALALDDAVYREDLIPLLELAMFVKVDLLAIPTNDLPFHVQQFRRYPVKLLAEKVETREDFTRCLDLGFEYFQGFFLSRPQMIPGKRGRPSEIAVLQVLGRLSDPNVRIDELEQIIKNDAALSYKLLRYINSARFGRQTKIESLRQVIVLLGLQGIRTMAMLASLAGTVDRPGDLLKDATQRALMCERLALLLKNGEPSACFTAGLISSLDAVFELPLSEILESLPLSDDLKRAIERRQGEIGEILHCAIANERADWDAIQCKTLTPDEIRGAYLFSIHEVAELWSLLGR
jgi:EAL and modified HD-GYP domain-containing signal transduction protein